MLKKGLPWYVVFYIVVLYFTAVLNQQVMGHFYSILDKSSDISFIFSLTPPLVLFSALTIVFLFFSFKFIFKGFMAFLIVTGAAVNYFANKYGIIFDYDMMVNILDTNPNEAKGYISLSSCIYIFLLGVIPALILCMVKIRWSNFFFKGVFQRLVILFVAIITIVAIAVPFYQTYASIGRNNNILRKELSPYNYVYYGYKAVKQKYFKKEVKFNKFGTESFIDNPFERPELFVIVVGETARAANFSFNGYSRNTTPYTDKLNNFLRFAPVATCGTATAVSVPYMFSLQGRNDYDEETVKNSSNLTDLIKYSGYDVFWYDNDSGCKGVCNRINNEILSASDPDFKGLCNADGCYDEVLVKRLEQRLKIQAKNKKSSVIFLHVIGSHGPSYFARSPDDKKIFFPTCNGRDLEKCSREEIVNAYDNTLVYTDYILSKVVKLLKNYQKDFGTGMFYISDHGESLGELGLYLHGTPYAIAPEEQKEVPMMSFLSDSFIKDHNIDFNCMKNQEKINFSQDNFYHSMLGILDVNTKYYDKNKDFFLKCRVWNKSNISSK